MNPEKIVKYSVPFFVIAIISRSIEEISFLYYAVPVMCVAYTVFSLWNVKSQKSKVKGQNYKVDRETSSQQSPESDIRHPRLHCITTRQAVSGIQYLVFIIPGAWFLMTSLWASYPEVSATRALYFILISTGCISAGVLWIRFSGRNIFEPLLPANVIVVLICLFSILTNIPSDSWTAGHGKGFIGFFGHQNLLASVLLFTVPVMFVKIKDKSQKIKGRKVFFFILLSLNLLVLTLTYSRSAIVALMFGVIVFLILNKNWKILSYSFISAVVITSIIYLTPAVNNFADKILKKDFPEVYSSRLWMWEPSYNAALEGGLFGLGYGISHPEIRSGEYSDRFEDGRLIREKGNSSLALIEESGLIGLILFILPIIYLLIKLPDTRYLIPDVKELSGTCLPIGKVRNPASSSAPPFGEFAGASSILIASLAAFILHAQFEAWWVGVGSVQLPLFFLYFGLIVQGSKLNSSKVNSFTV